MTTTNEEISTPADAIATPELPEPARLYGLTASYSPEDNKLRVRTVRRMPRELYMRFKARGFVWAPKQDLIVAPTWTPERHDFLLRMCGEIGDEETTLAERAEQRVDRFAGYRVNRTRDGERAHSAARGIMNGIPLGQPILVGHHSQARAERDARRIESSLKKAVVMWERADYWKERAEGVIHHANYKDLPKVRARRIETIEADKRKQEREKKKSENALKAWNLEPMTAELARAIAERSWLHVHTDEKGHGWHAWQVLRPESERTPGCPSMTWEEVREIARRTYAGHIEYTQRWINHYELRITYEKALLAAQGASRLLEKAPRPKQLPLYNYRAPEGVTVRHFGRTETLPQVEMTAAEYAAIYSERRGTRTVDGSHRVRYALLGTYHGPTRRDAVIFLTDSKEHKRPEPPAPDEEPAAPAVVNSDVRPAVAEEADEAPEARPVETLAAPIRAVLPAEPEEYRARFEAASTALEAVRNALDAGVRAVSADQLFQTAPELAAQVLDVADIRAGMRVLEPNAGMGSFLRAMGDALNIADVTAVEICEPLARALQTNFAPRVTVICRDFLQWGADAEERKTIGLFDRIVMNPPFAKGDDVRHVRHALTFLAPGGRLVAIMLNDGQAFRPEFQGEPGFGRRADAVAELRREAEAHGRELSVVELPDGSFASQGTGVRTVLVTIE